MVAPSRGQLIMLANVGRKTADGSTLDLGI